MFGLCFGVPHPQVTSPYFSQKILSCTLCTPSSNLNLNAFSSKIIQYIATYRDNSSTPGFDHPNMSPTYEKWSGGIACLSFGSHFTKNRHLATIKKKNHIFVSKNKKTIFCKVVGNGKMHKSAEDGFMILKFSMSSALALPKKHPFWAIWALVPTQIQKQLWQAKKL